MGTVSDFKRMRGDDIQDPRKAHEHLAQLSDNLNQYTDDLTFLLRGDLTFLDNFRAEERVVDLAHDTFLEVTLQSVSRPKIAFVVSNELEDWTRNPIIRTVNNNVVQVKVFFESTPTIPVETTLLFLG